MHRLEQACMLSIQSILAEQGKLHDPSFRAPHLYPKKHQYIRIVLKME